MSDETQGMQSIGEEKSPTPIAGGEEPVDPLERHEDQRRGPTIDVGSSTGAIGVSGTQASDFRVEDVDLRERPGDPEDQGPEPAA